MNEVIVIILAVLQVPIAILGATMPSNKSRIPPIVSGTSAFLILLILLGYINGKIPDNWLIPSSFVLTGVSILVTVIYVLRGRKNKGSSTLTSNDKKYMSRLNKELQDISDYYRELAGTINIKKISKAKIKKIDMMVQVYLGFKTITFSKPPKSSEKFKALCLIFYDLFKMLYLLIKVKFNSSYLIRIFLDIGSIPDDAGIGLSSYDTKGDQLTSRLLRVVGERIASNETIVVILRCKDACYAMNNIYLWLLMYPKGHKKSRIDFKKLIRTLYESREKMMAYAFADVNKAVIKEFLGD